MDNSLSADQIEEQLEELLGAVLSSRRTAREPALSLAKLERAQQDFALDWTRRISPSNSEMAFQFVSHVANALSVMETNAVNEWVQYAMDTYDHQGLYPGSAVLKEFENFAIQFSQNRSEVKFEQVAGVMDKYVKGVSGRVLNLKSDDGAWTDTETLYLPHATSEFDTEELNFRLVKTMGAYLWAQMRYGTFRVDRHTGIPIVCKAIGEFRDQQRALKIFEAVEEARLVACMEAELPGLVRQMNNFRSKSASESGNQDWEKLLAPVMKPDASVVDTLEAVEKIYRKNIKIPKPICYQGKFDLERVRLITQNRVENEKNEFRSQIALLAEGKLESGQSDEQERPSVQIQVNQMNESNREGEWQLELTVDGEPVEPPSDLVRTAGSIVQDFGEIPDEYLVPAGDGHYRKSGETTDVEEEQEPATESNVYYYHEWDFRRNHYRKNWCTLREITMHPSNEPFVEKTMEKYSHLVTAIRKSFETLRDGDRLMKKQANGDDIDIDSVVESYVDMQKGMEMTNRLYTNSRRLNRDLAVVFMVDISGSTKGWINDAERESLVLLCEALETLGDRYAIYGFSGMTRKRCELYRIKAFDDPYDQLVKARVAGMRPQDYTRMGVIIRHLSKLLLEVEAKTRVLITLSDGKPDDYDGYRGEYGIKDTRQALVEAKHAGVHPFCITIDTQAHDYLPQMYGHVNYTVVSDVRKLPVKVSDIYRRLTT